MNKGILNVIYQSDDNYAVVSFRYKPELKAEDGVSGAKKKMAGRAGKDLVIKMIALMCYVAVKAAPSLDIVARGTLAPDTINWMVILTLIGGTVGGYISFSGAHRLLNASIRDMKDATRAAQRDRKSVV